MGTEQSSHRARGVAACDAGLTLTLRNNYHPLRFHAVHGENIKLIKDRTVARRLEGFCKGIVFSDRPVTVFERVYVKFLDTSPNWSGALRIGFTMNDPASMKSKLPRYACPDLMSIHGNWAKAVAEKLAKKDSILYYYVDLNGDVHYGIGAEEHGVFFGGVNISAKLWAVLDIYGNTVEVEFVDPTNQESQTSESGLYVSRTDANLYLEKANLIPDISFHAVHGKNLTLKRKRTVVIKKTGSHSDVYVFTNRPLIVDEKIVMCILQTDHFKDDILSYGITSCNPCFLDPSELSENVYDLFDRPEYWVVKQESYSFKVGDYIIFSLNSRGEFSAVLNGTEDWAMFHVDHTQQLWLFFNLTHAVTSLELLGSSRQFVTSSLLEDFSNLHLGSSFCEGSSQQGGSGSLLEDYDDDLCLVNSFSEANKQNAACMRSGSQNPCECVICYEKAVDCVLYRCGHMCMCYECALKLWNSNSNSQCPICRDKIHDVIKTYK